MGFVKFDEMTDEGPKVIQAIDVAGEAAAWLWFRSICYSARALTDGFIPKAKAIELNRGRNPSKLARALVEARLWEEVTGGWLVHDYLDHQTSAADRREAKQKAAERQRKHRSRNGSVTPLRGHGRNGDVREQEVEEEVSSHVTGGRSA